MVNHENVIYLPRQTVVKMVVSGSFKGVVYHENVKCLPRQTVVYMVVSGRCMCLYAVVLDVVAVFVR